MKKKSFSPIIKNRFLKIAHQRTLLRGEAKGLRDGDVTACHLQLGGGGEEGVPRQGEQPQECAVALVHHLWGKLSSFDTIFLFYFIYINIHLSQSIKITDNLSTYG